MVSNTCHSDRRRDSQKCRGQSQGQTASSPWNAALSTPTRGLQSKRGGCKEVKLACVTFGGNPVNFRNLFHGESSLGREAKWTAFGQTEATKA